MQVTIFENIKHINDHHQEYWSAREMQPILWYTEWRNFSNAIEKAKTSCKESLNDVEEHFVDVNKPLVTWNNAIQEIQDIHLSRFACYLIAQNGDPRKQEIALAQSYFALQTRKQEIQENLLDSQKRVYLREEMTEHNKRLAKTAKEAWVWNYWEFTDFGYMGLYGWLRTRDIHKKKWLSKDEKILDHMGSEELAANLFRATQAEAKIKRESIKWQTQASNAHFEVGKKVRSTIRDIGGTMPEQLPKESAIKDVKKKLKPIKKLKKR